MEDPLKLSDYVVDFLSRLGAGHSFLVTGGAVLHLADSTARHPDIQHVCVQHEESGAAAADGYYRASGKLGVAMTTSGPGATNLMTSVCSAYFDSIPMICVTGQVARFRLRPNKKLRQRGFQETDVCSVYKSVCKYVTLVKDPAMIRYELEKATYLATEGRPGPVIIDIPDDLQRVEIDPGQLKSYVPESLLPKASENSVKKLFQLLARAKKPTLILGAGVRVAKAEKEALAFARHFNMPVFVTWGGADLLPYNDPLNMGSVGVCGPRAGNFAVQYSDLVIAMGTRLSQMITGGKQSLFAPNAKKAMIDIDREELKKFGKDTFTLDLAIHSDLKPFFSICEKFYQKSEGDRFYEWRKLISKWKERFPLCTELDYKKRDSINPYVFVKELSKFASDDQIIVTDTGANICWIMQSFETKSNQRIFSAWNHTPMGYALPASVGAAHATGKPILCLIGDGGLMMCLQELATVSRYNLPIKIFIFDNQGHATVKQTIDIWLNSNYVAVDRNSGLSFPNYEKLAETFGLSYVNFKSHECLFKKLPEVWRHEGPLVCHLEIDPNQKIVPMLKFGSGLDDLDPKLEHSEVDLIMKELQHFEISSKVSKMINHGENKVGACSFSG